MPEGWLTRGLCPECGSTKGNVQHKDGHSFCFSCETRFSNKEEKNYMNQTNYHNTPKTIDTKLLKTAG